MVPGTKEKIKQFTTKSVPKSLDFRLEEIGEKRKERQE